MNNKKSIIEKIASGKGFYITAALSFILIVTAIAFVYNTSTNMLKDLDIPTTHKQVEKNQTNVSDPRETSKNHTTTTNTTNSTSQQGSTAPNTTTNLTESITEEISEPLEVFSNDSYIKPLTSDIDRNFSMSPVYDETMEDWRIHKGIDYSAEAGTEVASIGNGKVIKVTYDASWGYCIDVDYGDFIARYCGLEQGTTVIIEDTVSKGDIIGKIGNIPCESKQESHLHFEIVRQGIWVDPAEILS